MSTFPRFTKTTNEILSDPLAFLMLFRIIALDQSGPAGVFEASQDLGIFDAADGASMFVLFNQLALHVEMDSWAVV